MLEICSFLEHEMNVLSAVIQKQVSESLTTSDCFSRLFVKKEHQELLHFINESQEKSFIFELETLLELLTERNALSKVGGERFLTELYHQCIEPETLNESLTQLKLSASIRSLIELMQINEIPIAYADDHKIEINRYKQLPDVSYTANRAEEMNAKHSSLNFHLSEVLSEIDRNFNSLNDDCCVAERLKSFSQFLNELSEPEVICISTPNSVIKDVIEVDILTRLCVKQSRKTVFISSSTSQKSIVYKLISKEGEIGYDRLKSGELEDHDWPRLTAAVSIIKDKPLVLLNDLSCIHEGLFSFLKPLLCLGGDVDLVIIDDTTLDKNDRIAFVNILNCFAKQNRCAIILMMNVHLNEDKGEHTNYQNHFYLRFNESVEEGTKNKTYCLEINLNKGRQSKCIKSKVKIDINKKSVIEV